MHFSLISLLVSFNTACLSRSCRDVPQKVQVIFTSIFLFLILSFKFIHWIKKYIFFVLFFHFSVTLVKDLTKITLLTSLFSITFVIYRMDQNYFFHIICCHFHQTWIGIKFSLLRHEILLFLFINYYFIRNSNLFCLVFLTKLSQL